VETKEVSVGEEMSCRLRDISLVYQVEKFLNVVVGARDVLFN